MVELELRSVAFDADDQGCPDSTSWSDVFPRAFEVVVRFAQPAVSPRPDPFRQRVASGTDPTWDASELPLE